jgi:hypothetical protein
LLVPVRHIWWLGLHTERRGAGVWPWHPFSEDFKDAQIRFIKEVIRGFRLL